jgi:transposase
MARTGRPTRLTPEVQETIVTVLKTGAYLETAAAFAGVSLEAVYAWMRRGKLKGRSIYKDFRQAVERASAEAEVKDLLVIDAAAKGATDPATGATVRSPNWNAAAWRLERRHPRKWGRFDRVEHEVGDETVKKGGLTVRVIASRETPPEALNPTTEEQDQQEHTEAPPLPAPSEHDEAAQDYGL